MKLSIVLLAGLVAANPLLDKRACVADNCLRALTGTAGSQGTARPVIASADCSSYFASQITVTQSILYSPMCGIRTDYQDRYFHGHHQ